MYSMVLMAAMLPSGDAAGFGKRSSGCHGTVVSGCTGYVPSGCTGYVAPVAPVAPVGCTGYYPSGCTGYSTGCTGYSAGCTGSHSCHGGGFLSRSRGGCCGGGGFLGKHKSHSCTGYTAGCTGYSAGCTGYYPAGGCVGTPVMTTPMAPMTTTPEVMPKK